MLKRKCVFNDELKKKYPSFKRGKEDGEVVCLVCNSSLSIASKGGTDLAEHVKTKKHQNSLRNQAGSSQQSMNVFLKKPSEDRDLRAAEGAIAYHNVSHHMSFNSMDCTLEINKKIYNDSDIAKKMTCNRTKCTAIVCNVLAPHSVDSLVSEIKDITALSVSTDASNHGNTKMFPVVLQYFNHKDGGITSKILDIVSVPNETSDTITDLIIDTLQKHNLTTKCIAFGADNCNTNFGGRDRMGTNNVFTKLKSKLQKEIIGVGCPPHIINNAVHHGCDTLPIDIESVVMKIYNYFSVYTVRNEALKQFCVEAETEYKHLLYHSKTRWLSLFPAVERLIRLFEPLKNYFATVEKCPIMIKNFFDDQLAEAYLYLIHSTMTIMHDNIRVLEREDNSVIEVLNVLTDVTSNLEQRVQHNFTPLKIREILRKLEERGCNVCEVKTTIRTFHQEMYDYLKSWMEPLNDFKIFEWMNLAKIDKYEWSSIEPSIAFFQEKGVLLDDSKLFNEWLNLKAFATNLTDEEKKLTTHKLWTKYMNQCPSVELYEQLLKIAEFFFCLPAHNANVERVFSLIKAQWTDERNKLTIKTVSSIILTKYNFKKYNCVQFYNYLLGQGELLSKIGKSDKYQSVPNALP